MDKPILIYKLESYLGWNNSEIYHLSYEEISELLDILQEKDTLIRQYKNTLDDIHQLTLID